MSARPLRLWIVDPSVHHAEDEGAAAVADGWPGEVRRFLPALLPGEGPGPSTGYEADAIVVMGSAASVADRLPWLEDLVAWARPLVVGAVVRPLLGICFGHQLVGSLAGGRVGWIHADRHKEVGVGEVRVEGSRLLPEGGSLRAVISHAEELQVSPRGWRVVAHRARRDAYGLEHPELPIVSFQFHPEAGPQFAVHSGVAVEQLDDRQRADSVRVLGAFREWARRAAGR